MKHLVYGGSLLGMVVSTSIATIANTSQVPTVTNRSLEYLQTTGELPIVYKSESASWGNALAALIFLPSTIAPIVYEINTRSQKSKPQPTKLEAIKVVSPLTAKPAFSPAIATEKATEKVSALEENPQELIKERSYVTVRTPTKSKEADDAWLKELVVDLAKKNPGDRVHNHLNIVGPSQYGKSVLGSYILKLLIETDSGSIFSGSDPKYPMTRWPFSFPYKGYETVLKAHDDTEIELEIRKKACTEAIERGMPMPEFSRFIFVQDEWDTVWSEGEGYPGIISKQDARLIRQKHLRFLKESAAYNFTLINIGQSPLNLATGFSRSDWNSGCRIILGIEALKYVYDSAFPFKNLADSLSQEINSLLSSDKRVCLVVPNRIKPYVKEIPKIDISQIIPASSPQKAEGRETSFDDPWEDPAQIAQVIPFRRK